MVNNQIAKRQRRTRKKNGPKVSMKNSKVPPCLPTVLHGHTTLRFLHVTANNASYNGFSVSTLMDMMFFAATATTGYRLFETIKIRRVSCWGSPSTNSSYSMLTLAYSAAASSSIGSQSIVYTDVSLNNADVSYVSAVPPTQSLAENWLAPGSAELIFEISCETAGVITTSPTMVLDIELDYTIINLSSGPLPIGRSYTSLVPGTIYAQDPSQASSPLWLSVGYDRPS